MSDILVAMDVGASRTRICYGDMTGPFPGLDPYIRNVGSVQALEEFLIEIRESLPETGRVRLVAGVAGPEVTSGTREMTNWAGKSLVSEDSLARIGFDDVALMNDLEASAHGLIAFLESDPPSETLIAFNESSVPAEGNRALVLPGSGLGSAGIIDRGPTSKDRWHVVASEAGHVLASGTGKGVLTAVERRQGRQPTWEDVVSGPGLEALWVAMAASHNDDPLSAPEIAYRAIHGDPRCQRALHYYYHFAARFSQLLTLAYLSFGGLFLAGGSTRSNAPLIRREEFLTAFCDNDRMGPILSQMPVFLVLAEITLLGSWTAGRQRFEARAQST
ncbi:MAG: glucokinase [Longimicrobiales bacterium]